MSIDDIRVRNTPLFKLKNKQGKNYFAINLISAFGFVPEVIIIEKPFGENNKILVRAILTPEEIKKEDARIKKEEKKNDKSSTKK